ncbi:TBC1 domain family member 1-like isoform X2 [Centruroides vittatus]|uniref:TBC1 domain family member 1-like isoform X2 n=1 Tax=Centruroides vittatus TaxID=120091 RepID=UPI00350F2681
MNRLGKSNTDRDVNDNTEWHASESKMTEERPRSFTSDFSHLLLKSHANHVTFQRTYRVVYVGSSVLNQRYSQPMLPWIISEIKLSSSTTGKEVFLEVTESSLKAVDVYENKLIFEHRLQCISKFAQTAHDHSCFSYLTKDLPDEPFICHVFQAFEENTVLELFTTIREMTKELVQQHNIVAPLCRQTSNLALDTILCNSQQYEVLYVGKIKVSHKRAPPTFIDEAVEKFKIFKAQQQEGRQRHGSGASISSLSHNLDMSEKTKEEELGHTNLMNNNNKENRETNSLSENVLKSSEESLNKDDNSDHSEYVKSPITPTEQFGNILNSEHSLITHTQSIDNPVRSSFIHDLKELAVLNSNSHMLQPPTANSLITHTQSLDTPSRTILVNDLHDTISHSNRVRSCSGDVPRPSKQTSLPVYRSRINSGESSDTRRSRAETLPIMSNSRQPLNRTMLFLIGRSELCLIGMDKKQALLSKTFNDISHCSQGIKNPDNFGFICREGTMTSVDCYVGYVFKGQTEKLVDEVMKALKQAFHSAHQTFQYHHHQNNKNQAVICETCPMHWFHKLCVELEGLSTEEAQLIIIKRLQSLPDNEREDIMLKSQGSDIENMQERNEVFMMLIRRLCEQKQSSHTHVSNGSHPTKVDKVPSKLDSFRQKAKKSLHSSFETILKLSPFDMSENVPDDISPRLPPYREGSYDAPDNVESEDNTMQRPRSSTIGTAGDAHKEVRRKISVGKKVDDSHASQTKSSIRDIFKKVGTTVKTPPNSVNNSPELDGKKGSWRQAIFNKVQTPIKQENHEIHTDENDNEDLPEKSNVQTKRSAAALRSLWKKAIMEQILLIRMEKENRKLQMRQSAVSSKRMKLDYEEITPCLKDAVQKWEGFLNDPDRIVMRIDWQKLQDAVKTGIPRHKRGEIWQFLAEQHCHHLNASISISEDVDLTMPYEDLLKQLTSHQHAILIDLGRTFPNHPYYSQPLGPGQLALFNLLKAYSLLDREVGYCQGLSFVAGILLLHMSEERAFAMMKHILFHLGFRRQYKPDMVALQIQMYQLSRLVHDHQRDIYNHFEKYDINPTLYAAPWFLTLYASQFPLGFVARLFDLIFLQGVEAVFKVALVLLSSHREPLLHCHGFESIMEFLKVTMPSMGIIQMERVFNQVFSLDIGRKLQAYEVEYHVLQEEMVYCTERGNVGYLDKLEESNRNLKRQNMELLEQLQVAHGTVSSLESAVMSHQSTVKRLEGRVRALEDEREALMHSVNIMRRRLEKLETAQLSSEASSPSESRAPSLGVINAYTGGEREEEAALVSLIKGASKETLESLLSDEVAVGDRKSCSSGSDVSECNSDIGSSL